MKKLKDIDKAYPFTLMAVRVFNRMGRLLLYNDIKSISHFSVVRDYEIALKYGGTIMLDPGVVEEIVAHELKENLDDYKYLLQGRVI